MKNLWVIGLICANGLIGSNGVAASFDNICADNEISICQERAGSRADYSNPIDKEALKLVPCALESADDTIIFDLAANLSAVLKKLAETDNFKSVTSIVCQEGFNAEVDSEVVYHTPWCKAYVSLKGIGATTPVVIDLEKTGTGYSLLVDTLKKMGIPHDGRSTMYSLLYPECDVNLNGVLTCTFINGPAAAAWFGVDKLATFTAKSCLK